MSRPPVPELCPICKVIFASKTHFHPVTQKGQYKTCPNGHLLSGLLLRNNRLMRRKVHKEVELSVSDAVSEVQLKILDALANPAEKAIFYAALVSEREQCARIVLASTIGRNKSRESLARKICSGSML